MATNPSPRAFGRSDRPEDLGEAGDAAANVIGYDRDNRDPDADGDPGVAEATYFQSKAGAKVFNAGSIRWAWGLGKTGFVEPAFQRFNENLVRGLSERGKGDGV